jgi:glutathione S-transferase
MTRPIGAFPIVGLNKLSRYPMMILRSAGASPFGRKIRIAASVLGLDGGILIETADPTDPADTLRRQNPLGKIPVLITEDGSTFYDSRVILEYLDHRAGGGRIIPAEATTRFAALRLQALCDGIMDASILRIYEGRWRKPDRHEPAWLDHQTSKVERALDALEAEVPPVDPIHVGQIALSAALGYLDLRFAGGWRKDHKRLVAWLDAFAAQVPAFAATRVAA